MEDGVGDIPYGRCRSCNKYPFNAGLAGLEVIVYLFDIGEPIRSTEAFVSAILQQKAFPSWMGERRDHDLYRFNFYKDKGIWGYK